eukprot:1161584-Pyramimonas_sp.AAC.1
MRQMRAFLCNASSLRLTGRCVATAPSGAVLHVGCHADVCRCGFGHGSRDLRCAAASSEREGSLPE